MLKSCSLTLVFLLIAYNAYAWGDETWAPQTIQVEVQSAEPDYLQQRIETRRARAEAKNTQLDQIKKSMQRNDWLIKTNTRQKVLIQPTLN